MADEACHRACMTLGPECMQVQDARQMLQVLVMGMKTLLYSMATYGNTVLSRSNMPPRYDDRSLDGGRAVDVGQMPICINAAWAAWACGRRKCAWRRGSFRPAFPASSSTPSQSPSPAPTTALTTSMMAMPTCSPCFQCAPARHMTLELFSAHRT